MDMRQTENAIPTSDLHFSLILAGYLLINPFKFEQPVMVNSNPSLFKI